MLVDTFLGCSIFLITNVSLLYASHLLVRRFLPDAPASVRLAAIGTLVYAFIILIFQALSPFHAIAKTWVTISSLLIALAAHLLWGGLRDFRAELAPIAIWVRDGLNSKWAALIIMCGFIVLLSLSRALLMPPLAWDCLTYHLTYATLLIKRGAISLFTAPDQIAYTALFPINGELFAAWIMLPFGNDVLVNTVNFPLLLLGGISCYAIARELGLSRQQASFAPALLCFAPVMYVIITTGYVDIATCTFSSISVLFALRYLKRGNTCDYWAACVAGGVLCGLKYNGIPAVVLIFIVLSIRMIRMADNTSMLRKMSMTLLGMIVIGTFGGRQYIVNTIEAGNPLYPFPVTVANHEIFKGSLYLEEVKDWLNEYERKYNWDKFSLWEKEYRKFCYLEMTAGPKFFLFLLIAGVSLFMRPPHLSRRIWYFVSAIWIIPVVLFYANTSTDFARRAYWTDGSFRFLSPYIALCTIQSLVFIQSTMGGYPRAINIMLSAFIAWDLLNVNKSHLWSVAVIYPFIIVAALIFMFVLNFLLEKSGRGIAHVEHLLISPRLQQRKGIAARRWISAVMVIIMLCGGLYFLQCYRDATRYKYYRGHLDLHDFPRLYIDAWEFLDQPGEKRKIAMTAGWDPPSHHWFFYPLFGRFLQNDIAYISAKHKWHVPTWLDRGMLRGSDFSIWLFNLKREKIDYILVQKPWPIELQWLQVEKELFQLVFSNDYSKIYKYTGS